MQDFPYHENKVDWKRPAIDKAVLQECTRRSDLQGWIHSVGVLAILGSTGSLCWWLFQTQQWLWLALALYLHGGVFAFNPQTHEFSHGTVFKTKALNTTWARVYGILHWNGNPALYKMSHAYHHQYTLHRQSEGEEVHPKAELSDELWATAFQVIDLNGFVGTLYDQIKSLFVPFARNSRRKLWLRYVYAKSSRKAQRDLWWTTLTQLLVHVVFGVFAVAAGQGFLIVVVSLPAFYGARWYHQWVHDTMHVGREPESDDFRLCCRTVKVDPLTSFLFWHMEWHTEHHAFAGVPCYHLGKFHRRTKDLWYKPQTLVEAWREMNRHSRKLLALEGD
ncbi:MAG: fatty acid desaturase [Spirochaetales bacterium]